ncbi:hypothetical protein [Geothrix sp. 21YS21S-2]|uniref:hypothetical protein n=1 Tax=Geothrix sp. 21YS21S-2 TaxID=3068893 RepID=UPI0027BB1255|nr:hypothetical protein [Geothrix sp. 21YS21S-2]
MFDAVLLRHGWTVAPASLARAGAAEAPLDEALRLALEIAREDVPETLDAWREAMQAEARRRLYPQRFGTGEGRILGVADAFFPLADAARLRLPAPSSLSARLPFQALAEAEQAPWPSGEQYRRLLGHLEEEGFLVAMAMAQFWRGFSIQDHVLGVTGLALWIGRQLAKSIPVDLPLLHGGAIGHDVGKFGCVGDEAKRIPRLHYYYTHQYYASRDLGGLGHIATNHSCWDLELIRLPIETQVLIYCDFRVKDVKGPDGKWRMEVISLKEAFDTILDKLEDVDAEKRLRYQAVYRKLRDMEDYALSLGVELDPPGFEVSRRRRPWLPPGLDIVALMAGNQRPDTVALAAGGQVPSTARLVATAHNIGVMERLRDLPALRRLLEEARSFNGWRDLRTYVGIVGDYAPAFSEEQKALALDFFRELLSHPDDDIRYQAACRMADLLALGEVEWRKDLPVGAALEERPWVMPHVIAVLDLLDLAPKEAAEDMGPEEQILYGVPIFLRRFFSRANPKLAAEALPQVVERLLGRAADRRPLSALYTCESFELLAREMDPAGRLRLPKLIRTWGFHEVANVRLMAWRVLHVLANFGQQEPALLEEVGHCVDALGAYARPTATVAELFLLERCAALSGRAVLADRCREMRGKGRSPIREVMLRNLKGQTGWVEKKVACDFLVSLVSGPDFDSRLVGEVGFHLANLLKVSRVEGTRFHAGRCLVGLIPLLTDTQRNDLAIELLRSLQLDGEGVTRYLPRFLGPLLASLPAQELDELLDDMALDARRGAEGLQQLLVQASTWLILALPLEAMGRILRLAGLLLGALADSRVSVAHEGYAHVAVLLDWLREAPDPRLAPILAHVTKKVLTLVKHLPGERARFFLAAEALSSLDKALAACPVAFPRAPRVGFLPGTFDPFTSAHGEMVHKALAHCEEVFVQVDDFSWRKHAQPRYVRDELAWMALSTIPGAYIFPFDPPVNIANTESLVELQAKLGRRPLHLIVGTDVLEGASAYRRPASPIWAIPHLLITREEANSRRWEGMLEQFTAGVQVFQVGARMKTVSSTSLREAFDRRGELDLYCDPLVARTLLERRLYVNYPARKEEIFESQWKLRFAREGRGLPTGLVPLAQLDTVRAVTRWTGHKPRTAVLQSRETGEDLAAITWVAGTAAALPVALEDESLAGLAGGRLMGSGALVEAVGCSPGDTSLVDLDQLLSRIIGQWFSEGLLFALIGVPEQGGERLWKLLRHHGAGWLGDHAGGARGLRWAGIELTRPLVMIHDLEQLLQHPYLGAEPVEEVILKLRRSLAGFFAERMPGSGLLHIHEKEIKRQLSAWTQERLAKEGPGWVALGLGRQFSRDTIGNVPTLSLDIERYLTGQGYEAGVGPSYGSPSLERQLTTARELGRNAILLVPFLDSADQVIRIQEACRKVKIRLREVFVGATSASVNAALHMAGVPHRTGLVVPHWRGVVRESAVIPFVGGWTIRDRRSMGLSLTPSLNDCLPYHNPHPLGLSSEEALDFSRLALEQSALLFQVLEDAFRAHEGRLLSLADLAAVVRHPRCPPFPRGFVPPRDCAPSEFISQDLEALARLLPDAHKDHRAGWGRR